MKALYTSLALALTLIASPLFGGENCVSWVEVMESSASVKAPAKVVAHAPQTFVTHDLPAFPRLQVDLPLPSIRAGHAAQRTVQNFERRVFAVPARRSSRGYGSGVRLFGGYGGARLFGAGGCSSGG